MKKIIVLIAAVLIVLGSVYVFKVSTKDKVTVASSEQAIALIKEQKPELKDYPSDNLPPKRIEVKEIENGWQLGFFMEGSGLPGILSAKCYLVTTTGTITATGEFSAGGKAGPSSLDLSTCKDPVSEEVLAYFTSSLNLKARATIKDFNKLGLGDDVDGFTLIKVYPNLLPVDFDGVPAYQGSYSLMDGKLLFTGHAASNSAVLKGEGMGRLLLNSAKRLKMPFATKGDVDKILIELERK